MDYETTNSQNSEVLAIRGHHLKNLRDAIRDPKNYWAKLFDYITSANPEDNITIVAGIPTRTCENCRIKTRWHYDRCEAARFGESKQTRIFDESLARASGFRVGETYKVGDLISKLKSQNAFGRGTLEAIQVIRLLFSSII